MSRGNKKGKAINSMDVVDGDGLELAGKRKGTFDYEPAFPGSKKKKSLEGEKKKSDYEDSDDGVSSGAEEISRMEDFAKLLGQLQDHLQYQIGRLGLKKKFPGGKSRFSEHKSDNIDMKRKSRYTITSVFHALDAINSVLPLLKKGNTLKDACERSSHSICHRKYRELLARLILFREYSNISDSSDDGMVPQFKQDYRDALSEGLKDGLTVAEAQTKAFKAVRFDSFFEYLNRYIDMANIQANSHNKFQNTLKLCIEHFERGNNLQPKSPEAIESLYNSWIQVSSESFPMKATLQENMPQDFLRNVGGSALTTGRKVKMDPRE